MNHHDWLELVQLAEALCPAILLDLQHLTISDARDVLLWLRRKAREVTA